MDKFKTLVISLIAAHLGLTNQQIGSINIINSVGWRDNITEDLQKLIQTKDINSLKNFKSDSETDSDLFICTVLVSHKQYIALIKDPHELYANAVLVSFDEIGSVILS